MKTKGINIEKTYIIGKNYDSVKERACNMLNQYVGNSGIIHFHDSDKKVTFLTERLVPCKSSERPNIMLLFSNPHPHSIQQGMFLSPNTKNLENPFWSFMEKAGWFSIPESNSTPANRRDIFLNIRYQSPFTLFFCCYYDFPTDFPDDILKIFGKSFFEEVISIESKKEFINSIKKYNIESIITFNKGIYNLVAENKVNKFIDNLNKGEIVQSPVKDIDKQIPIFLSYPTGWHYHRNIKTLRNENLKKIMDEICRTVQYSKEQNT